MSEPNNTNSETNPVGRFMVAVGAVISHKNSGKILLLKRSSELDWHPNEWEIPYGRIAQHEDLSTALKREVEEETGLTELVVGKILRHWHIYRGSRSAKNELIGLTFSCQTNQENIKLSPEHSEYRWAEAEEALRLVKVEGIRADVEEFLSL